MSNDRHYDTNSFEPKGWYDTWNRKGRQRPRRKGIDSDTGVLKPRRNREGEKERGKNGQQWHQLLSALSSAPMLAQEKTRKKGGRERESFWRETNSR